MGAGEAVDALSGKEPRKSWQMRKRQERAALKEGLAEWQVFTPTSILCTPPAQCSESTSTPAWWIDYHAGVRMTQCSAIGLFLCHGQEPK